MKQRRIPASLICGGGCAEHSGSCLAQGVTNPWLDRLGSGSANRIDSTTFTHKKAGMT